MKLVWKWNTDSIHWKFWWYSAINTQYTRSQLDRPISKNLSNQRVDKVILLKLANIKKIVNPSLCLDEQDLETCHNQALILLFNFFKKMTGYKNNVACFRPEDCKRKRAKDRPCFVKLLRSTRLNSCFHTCLKWPAVVSRDFDFGRVCI